jgi:putative resolvase
LSGKRPKLRRILSDPSASVVIVEHRIGWLASGASTSRPRSARRAGDDLVRDMIDVLTSMCARLYRRRGARNRAMRAVAAAAAEPGRVA